MEEKILVQPPAMVYMPLTYRDPSLRNFVEPYLHNALAAGTPAMLVRARDALARLQSSRRKP